MCTNLILFNFRSILLLSVNSCVRLMNKPIQKSYVDVVDKIQIKDLEALKGTQPQYQRHDLVILFNIYYNLTLQN